MWFRNKFSDTFRDNFRDNFSTKEQDVKTSFKTPRMINNRFGNVSKKSIELPPPQRFEDKGMTLLGLKMILASEDTLEEHYSELKERPFFGALMAYVRVAIQQNNCWHGKTICKAKDISRFII